jgi:hypothetical protein
LVTALHLTAAPLLPALRYDSYEPESDSEYPDDDEEESEYEYYARSKTATSGKRVSHGARKSWTAAEHEMIKAAMAQAQR